MATCCRLLLQCDWQVALRETDGKAWVALQDLSDSAAKPTLRGQLINRGMSATGLPYVEGSNGFSVKNISKDSLHVCYNDEASNRFAPSEINFQSIAAAFTSIHKKKSVICLDVTNGGLGVSSSSDGTMKVWQTDTGEVRRDLVEHVGDVYTCRFFPSGIVVLSGGADLRLKVWSVETGRCAATFIGHRGAVLDTAIVERGRNIVSCSRDGSTKLWDCSQQMCLDTFEGMAGSVNGISVGVTENSLDLGQPDKPPGEKEVLTEGKMLLMACESNSFLSYGLQSRKKIFHYECSDAVNCCTFLSENTAVCGTQNGKLSIIDLRNYNVPLKEFKTSNSAIESLYPHRGGFFISAHDGSCHYVNNQYDSYLSLTGPDCDPVYRVVCNNNYIFTACRDGHIRKYRLNIP